MTFVALGFAVLINVIFGWETLPVIFVWLPTAVALIFGIFSVTAACPHGSGAHSSISSQVSR